MRTGEGRRPGSFFTSVLREAEGTGGLLRDSIPRASILLEQLSDKSIPFNGCPSSCEGLSEGILVAQVRVSKFTVFAFTGRRDAPSSRYARPDTISIIGGKPVRGSDILVDERDLDEIGMTKPGFKAKGE